MGFIFQFHLDLQMLLVKAHTNAEPQEPNIQTLKLDHAHGICNHPQMTTIGLLLVETTATLIQIVLVDQDAVFHSTLDTLILSKRHAVTI